MYLGMCAGVGKTYRMLSEAQQLVAAGQQVCIGYIETHGRLQTEALTVGLPTIPRRNTYYKGRLLEEMDLDTLLSQKPRTVLVDELAHTNIPGSRNEKRWQDVLELLNAGINVISAVNVQHLESLNREVNTITGIEVQERIPDSLLQQADEVVNIDLTADELIKRLHEGHIYEKTKIPAALSNFFKPDTILQLRELALREAARLVERKIVVALPPQGRHRAERFMACISTNEKSGKNIIRKTARLAAFYDAYWLVCYVQSPSESVENINLSLQRHLLNNLRLAAEMGADVLKVKADNIAEALAQTAAERNITTLIIGRPHFGFWSFLLKRNLFNKLLRRLAGLETDLIIVS